MPGVSTIHACTEVVLNLFTFSDIGDPNSIGYQASAVAQDLVSVRLTWQSSGYKKWGYLCGYKKMGIPLNIHIYHISVDSDLIQFFLALSRLEKVDFKTVGIGISSSWLGFGMKSLR